MTENELTPEIEILSKVINPALNGVVVSCYTSNYNIITIASYRQSIVELATYIKLSSAFNAIVPVDCYVTDKIENKYRFTVIYAVQAASQNVVIKLVTKTTNLLPMVSLQGIYPAFN